MSGRAAARGQSTLEVVILVGSVAAALVAMGIYLQRGYQGYLRNASQAHGTQFDPEGAFSESRKMNAYTRSQDIQVTSGEASVPGVNNTQLPARLLTTKVHTETAWDMTRSGVYEAQ